MTERRCPAEADAGVGPTVDAGPMREERVMTAISPQVLRAGTTALRSTYVYDLNRLRLRCRLVERLSVGRKRIFFATMANDHPEILACIRDSGLGVFVNSPLHLELVLGLGFEPAKIIYAASNMIAEEMQRCVAQRVNLVLDSLEQIHTLCDIASDVQIGIRLNVGSALDRTELRHDPSYRFGLVAEELPPAVDLATRRGIRIVGAHSYLGTDVMQPTVLLQGLERLGLAAAGLPDLRYLDVGGGFGVPDVLGDAEFDLWLYGRAAAELMRRHERRLGRPLELYIEPGRYLVADSGYFFVKVVECKVREDRVFVGTNGSVAEFPRPLVYPERARHPCEIVGADRDESTYRYPAFVCGNTTYSQDFLARDVALPLPRPGDILVFHNAGAYGRSMSTRFLGRQPVEEIVVETAAAPVLVQGR
jgi:diaminopimelate decarboxylase